MRVNMVKPYKRDMRVMYYMPPDHYRRVDRKVDETLKPKNKDHEFLRKLEVSQ